jgi:phosphoribosylaminoimidazolecarboxamide formyltransferase/IMP cyclohydrolase
MKKRALISVYDKSGIEKLARFLANSAWEIVSTGGTFRFLQEQRIPVVEIQAVTRFPELLDGRVKTLHPTIHAGILARRDDPLHMDTLKEHALETIDLVCVNLYPFF